MSFSVSWLIDGPNTSHVEPGGRIVSKYKRTYLYRTDATTPPTDAQIATDVGIYPGSPHPEDSHATCQSVEISHGVGPTKCPHFARHVAVEWATNAVAPNAVNTDPTTRRVLWDIATNVQAFNAIKDRLGKMILNAAGQPFDGGVPTTKRTGIAVAQKNRDASGYDSGNVMRNSGSLNSDTYLGAAPGTLQVDIKAKEHFEGDFHWWDETYSFAYDPLGWQPKPLDAGFFQRKFDGGEYTFKAVADAGSPTGFVWELDSTTAFITPSVADVNAIFAGTYPQSPAVTDAAGYPLTANETYTGVGVGHDLVRITNRDVGELTSPNDPVQEPEPLLATGLIAPVSGRPDNCRFVAVDYFPTTAFSSFGL